MEKEKNKKFIFRRLACYVVIIFSHYYERFFYFVGVLVDVSLSTADNRNVLYKRQRLERRGNHLKISA